MGKGAGRRVVPLLEVAAAVRARRPLLGRTRLVLVDGPSGSGKTVLAGRLAARLRADAIHMDDLYPGWDGLADAVPTLVDDVLRPLAEGRPGRYRRYDWDAGRYAEAHEVRPGEVLVVEGVGCGSRAPAAWAGLLVWVEAPREVRFRRGLERDGVAYEPHWRRWARQEDELFAAEGTRGRADLRVDGDPGDVAHDPEREVVLLDP